MLGKKKKAMPVVNRPQEPIKLDMLETVNGTYQTVVPDSYKNRKTWVRPDERQIFSFIPGTITEISVSVGSQVEKGDKLMMFKAMKMDNTFLSPCKGVVRAIHVSLGEIVPKGVMVLEFE